MRRRRCYRRPVGSMGVSIAGAVVAVGVLRWAAVIPVGIFLAAFVCAAIDGRPRP